MKKKISRFFTDIRFKREFRNQIRFFIIVTFGFTIAFTWRQTIFDLSQAFILSLTHLKPSSFSTILTSSFITFVSIFLIFFTSHFLKDYH